MNILIYKGLKLIYQSRNINSLIYIGLKFIVSIQKHEFMNLQRVIVDLSIRKKNSLIYQGLKFIVSIQK